MGSEVPVPQLGPGQLLPRVSISKRSGSKLQPRFRGWRVDSLPACSSNGPRRRLPSSGTSRACSCGGGCRAARCPPCSEVPRIVVTDPDNKSSSVTRQPSQPRQKSVSWSGSGPSPRERSGRVYRRGRHSTCSSMGSPTSSDNCEDGSSGSDDSARRNAAATTIQKRARGFFARMRFRRHKAAVMIQKHVKGLLVRRKARQAQQERQRQPVDEVVQVRPDYHGNIAGLVDATRSANSRGRKFA
mmetsp:Transcript_11211/g.35276  ORF Transcript_11211/g.35276 Transcript_11211/m.35276 type:complete len:243 (+) Transcript_11211:558-1286(+)